MNTMAEVFPGGEGGRPTPPAPGPGAAGLSEMVDHLDEVVFGLDARGCWTFLNAAWERRFGWARAECLPVRRPA